MSHALAATAETTQTTSWQTSEYALALERLRSVGQVMLDGLVEVHNAPDTFQLKAEFDTSLSEMLKTDEEFGKLLQITRFDRHAVIDGHVVGADGVTKVADTLANGYRLSSKLAEQDTRMQTQANRDYWDLQNAHEVNAMVRGERGYNTRIVASLMPEEAIARDGEDYWRGMGYFPETKTAFIQMYHMTATGELLTGTLSVDATDKVTMARLWRKAGVEIPEDEMTDAWLSYAITDTLTSEQATELVLSLRQQHYTDTGYVPTNPTSIEEVLEANKVVVEQSFDELQLSLAEAIAKRHKTPAVASLVEGYMAKARQLSPDIRHGLMRTGNRQVFDDADARLVYKLIMYATAERIRASMKTTSHPEYKYVSPVVSIESAMAQMVSSQAFMQQVIYSAHQGIAQRRSYGACGAAIDLSSDNDPLKTRNPQNVFGGLHDLEDSKKPDDEDEYGSLVFECTEGHENKRPKGKLIDRCQTRGCKGSVGCG